MQAQSVIGRICGIPFIILYTLRHHINHLANSMIITLCMQIQLAKRAWQQNKGRVKFNFISSSLGSQRFGIKFYFWRPLWARERERQVAALLLIRAQLVSVWVIHSNTYAHTHTHTYTHTFVEATKNLIFSHYLCILAKAAGENTPTQPENQSQPIPKLWKPKLNTNPNRTQTQWHRVAAALET